jgi:hypothetical protein
MNWRDWTEHSMQWNAFLLLMEDSSGRQNGEPLHTLVEAFLGIIELTVGAP